MTPQPNTVKISHAANAVMHKGKFLYDAHHGKDHVFVTADQPLQNGHEIDLKRLKEINDIFGGTVNKGHKSYHLANAPSTAMDEVRALVHNTL